MTAATTVKTWYLVHKWTSLVCTLFLLVICLTGLPLIFHHEIEHLLDEGKPVAELPANAPLASLDQIVAQASTLYPGDYVDYVFRGQYEPPAYVGMLPEPGKTVAQDGRVEGRERMWKT